jgi:TonB family protein
MRLIEADLIRWRKRRWLWFLLVMVAIHVVAIAWFSAHGPLPRSVYPRSPTVTLLTGDGNPASELGTFDEYEDPTLFAAPHQHGFSSTVWLGKPAHLYDILSPPPSPRLLSLGEALEILTQKKSSQPPPDVFASIKKYSPPMEKPSLLGPINPPQSELRIEGALANRTLLNNPTLPPEYFNDALGNTIVEAGVDGDGFVLSARILSGSGFKQADQDAIAITRGLRFAPEREFSGARAELTWGKLIFDWFGLELTGTNAPAKR